MFQANQNDSYYKEKIIEFGQLHPGSFEHAYEVLLREEESQRDVFREAEQFYKDMYES